MQDLFGYYSHDRNSTSLWRFIGIKKLNICKALVLSIAFHFTLGLALYLSAQFSSDLVKSNNQGKSLFDVIAQSRHAISNPQGMDGRDLVQIGEYAELLKRIKIQNSSLSKEEVFQITDTMIESLITMKKEQSNLGLSTDESEEEQLSDDLEDAKLKSGTRIFKAPPSPGNNEIRFNVLEKDKSEEFNKLSEKITAVKEDFTYSGERVRINLIGGGFKIVPAGYFFRDSPYEELLAQGANLFYVITGFPSIYKKTAQTKKLDKDRNPVEQNILDLKQLDVFLVEKSSQDSDYQAVDMVSQELESKKKYMNDQEINQILDDLMTLPELEQIEKFKTDFLEGNEIDDQTLFKLTQEFTGNNLSSMMFDISDVTSAFDYMEEIYFNKALDHSFYEFWLSDPNSRIGVEFLLCLADHIRFEGNGLFYLQKAYKEASDFLSQKYHRTEIFNKRQKCFIIKEIYDELVRQLPSLGFRSIDEVLSYYQEVEKGVYNLVLELGEEARNIGLYELGRQAWNQEQYIEALDYWNIIDDSYSTKSLEGIRRVVSQNQEQSQIILGINSSLNWNIDEEQRDFIIRLVTFGKWKNRYKKK
ncbi:MAG: hypothetical protein MUP98_14635 [Candidatus Aminicenantes bacterium]|nr:hypothetical protein [Candidatus Aminicenantes bacterium]